MPSYAFFYFCDQANSSDFLEQITENNDDITALLFAVIAGSSFPCLKILIQVDNLIWRNQTALCTPSMFAYITITQIIMFFYQQEELKCLFTSLCRLICF